MKATGTHDACLIYKFHSIPKTATIPQTTPEPRIISEIDKPAFQSLATF